MTDYVLSSLNNMCYASVLICKSLICDNIHLVMQVQERMLALAQQLEQNSEQNSESPSARKINAIMLKGARKDSKDKSEIGLGGSAQT